jgi:hypothetical protein
MALGVLDEFDGHRYPWSRKPEIKIISIGDLPEAADDTAAAAPPTQMPG